jgi:hypothetical protein
MSLVGSTDNKESTDSNDDKDDKAKGMMIKMISAKGMTIRITLLMIRMNPPRITDDTDVFKNILLLYSEIL